MIKEMGIGYFHIQYGGIQCLAIGLPQPGDLFFASANCLIRSKHGSSDSDPNAIFANTSGIIQIPGAAICLIHQHLLFPGWINPVFVGFKHGRNDWICPNRI